LTVITIITWGTIINEESINTLFEFQRFQQTPITSLRKVICQEPENRKCNVSYDIIRGLIRLFIDYLLSAAIFPG
jgi:hypothetical protein